MSARHADVVVNISARTDVGMCRRGNEDCFMVADLTTGNTGLVPEVSKHRLGESGSLLVVSDGMGGAVAGEIASDLSVRSVKDYLVRSSPHSTVSDRLRSAVEAVLTSNDPADVCGRFATERYLKAAYGDKQGCVRAQQPGSAARSLKSFGVAQEAGQGTSVVADAVPVGGPYGGHTVHVGLVFAGDRYRVDSMKADLPVGP